MRRAQAARHVAEEGSQFGLDQGFLVGLARGLEGLAPGLLLDAQLEAQTFGQARHRLGHQFRQQTGALAAAGDQQAYLLARGIIGQVIQGADVGAHRIAHHHRAGLHLRRGAFKRRKGAGHLVHARGQEPVHPAEHCILFVDQGRTLGPGGGQERRQAGIAAKAHHHRRIQAGERRLGLAHPPQNGQAGIDHAQHVAALEGGRVQGQALDTGKLVGIQSAALIGGQHDAPAASTQGLGQGLGGKQMSAGAAGGQHRQPGRRANRRPAHA